MRQIAHIIILISVTNLISLSEVNSEVPNFQKTLERGAPALRKQCRKILIKLFSMVSRFLLISPFLTSKSSIFVTFLII